MALIARNWVWPPQPMVYAPWWYFLLVIGVIVAAAAALVWLPFVMHADRHRYDPPQTRVQRRHMPVEFQADGRGGLRRKVPKLKRQEKSK